MKDYFSRRLETTLAKAAAQFPAVIVTGPRQSGKTSLLRHQFAASHAYVTLDDPAMRRFAAGDPAAFIEDNPPPVIIDEIQYAPELLPYLKLHIDAHRERAGQYLLTGSQAFPLMQHVSESLAGRIGVLRLHALSLAENPQKRIGPVQSREAYARWILDGSYPELHGNPALDSPLWYASYLQTYLERDVRALANIGNLRGFDRLLGLLAARSGALLNYASLSRDLGVAANTVRSWISILEASGIVFLCPAFFDSLGKRIIKSPKVYFLETGLLANLTRLGQADHVLKGPMAGAIFETLVGGEIYRLMADSGERPALCHYRTVGRQEVDFVFEHQGRVHGIECKLSASPRDEDSRSLREMMQRVPEARRGASIVICTAPRRSRHHDVTSLPVFSFADLRCVDDLLEAALAPA